MQSFRFRYRDTAMNLDALERESRERNYAVTEYIPTALHLFLKQEAEWMKDDSFSDRSVKLPIKLTAPVSEAWTILLDDLKKLGYPRVGFVLLRSMMVYAIINQKNQSFCADAKAAQMGKVMPNSHFSTVYIPESTLSDFKDLCKNEDISVNQYVTYFAYLLTKNSDLLLQIFADSIETNVADKMRIFCNRIFGLNSEESLDCLDSLATAPAYFCLLNKEDMDRIVAIGEEQHIVRSVFLRYIVRYAVRNHLVKSKIENRNVKKATAKVVNVSETDKNLRLSIRIPKQLRDDFQSYCQKKQLTVSFFVKLFIENLGNKQFIETVMKSGNNAKGDANVSIYIGAADLEKLKVYAAAIGSSCSKMLRCFMSYCLSDGFDWTRLEDSSNGT